jgi:dihydrolipoamide dehydrogenase
MTSDREFDVDVIGAGPGGYATALYGASAGLSIAVVQRDKVGGTCLNRGCIPAKTFLQTASVVRAVAGAKEFGVQASQPSVDFALSQTHKQTVVDQLHRGLAGLMKHRRISLFAGTGAVLPGRKVRIDGDGDRIQISARHIVLATGSAPRGLPGFNIDHEIVLTSDDVLDLGSLPRSVAIVGGGVIGCEFASMFSEPDALRSPLAKRCWP